MANRAKPPTMWDVLTAPDQEMERTEEAFLRGRSAVGDHTFLISAVRGSDIRPSACDEAEEL